MLSLIVNTGMWFERFVIVVTSAVPRLPPLFELGNVPRDQVGLHDVTSGPWGCLPCLFFLFVRFLPMIPMSEIRMMLPSDQGSSRRRADAEVVMHRRPTNAATRREFTAIWPSSTRRANWSMPPRLAHQCGLSPDGVLHALSGRRSGRGAALPQDPRPA